MVRFPIQNITMANLVKEISPIITKQKRMTTYFSLSPYLMTASREVAFPLQRQKEK